MPGDLFVGGGGRVVRKGVREGMVGLEPWRRSWWDSEWEVGAWGETAEPVEGRRPGGRGGWIGIRVAPDTWKASRGRARRGGVGSGGVRRARACPPVPSRVATELGVWRVGLVGLVGRSRSSAPVGEVQVFNRVRCGVYSVVERGVAIARGRGWGPLSYKISIS